MGAKTGLLAVALAIALVSQAKADAVCLLDIQGSGEGTARCTGSIGRWTVDPSPVPAELGTGRLAFYPRRLMSLDPHPTMTFSGQWSSAGPLVSGQGVIEGAVVPFTGDMRKDAGGVQMELVLGRARTKGMSTRPSRRCASRTRIGVPVAKPK